MLAFFAYQMSRRSTTFFNHSKKKIKINHLLLNCKVALEVWSSVLGGFGCSWVLSKSIGDLFDTWKFYLGSPKGKILLRSSFIETILVIWKEINLGIFVGKGYPLEEIVARLRFNVASRSSILPEFWGVPIESILHNCKELAFH